MNIEELLNSLANAKWLNSLVEIMMNVLIAIVKILLLPFDIIIRQFFPGFTDVIQNLQHVFDYAGQYAGWFLSAFAIPSSILAIVVIYYTFIISARFYLWFIKTALRWIRAIKVW